MKKAWLLAFVLSAACGHAESPGASVALGPSRACAEGLVDDGFECVAKHATDTHAASEDHDDDRLGAKAQRTRECSPFDDDCDDDTTAGASLANEADYFAHGLKAYQAHDFTQARRLFFEMLQKYPNGNHPDDAYYYFGLMFLDEANKAKPVDPTKLGLATQAFEQVTLYPTSTQLTAALTQLVRIYGTLNERNKQMAAIQRLQAAVQKMGITKQPPPAPTPKPPPTIQLQMPPTP